MKLIRWTICAAALLALVLLSGQSILAAPPRDNISDLDAFIQQALKDYNVPGAAVSVVKDGKVVLAKGYGVRDATKPGAVDENTIFQLASVTKTLTGGAAGTVVDEGKLDWDTPIFNYLPEFVGYDPYMTRWMTIRDLLAMRTGWPAFSGDEVDSFGYDRAEILHQLRYFKPKYSLREVAQYSNMGFFTAGEVAAAASGLSWNELVEKRLFAPLEMTRSGTVVKGLNDSNMSAAHALVDGKPVVVEPSILDTTGAASSGTSTAADMAHWMMMLLNHGKYNDTEVLKPDTVDELFKRSMVGEIEFSELPPISNTTGFYYGMGFDSYDYANQHIIEKAGALAGVRTIVTLLPEQNSAIFVASNMNLAPFPEAVRAFFINQELGIDPQTDQKKILEALETIDKIIAPPPAPTNVQPFTGTLGSLVGVYENDYYGKCEILLNGEDLTFVCGPAKDTATIKHWNNGAFVTRFPGATQADALTTFEIGQDGKANSVNVEGLGMFTRVQEKE